MAETKKTETAEGNPAVPHEGDHDRVVMLSLKADGSPDQHNPEIIGDKKFAEEAAKRQFAEQAVSAADVARRGVSTTAGEKVEQDPSIAEAEAEAKKVAEAAEKAAVSAVGSLHKGE